MHNSQDQVLETADLSGGPGRGANAQGSGLEGGTTMLVPSPHARVPLGVPQAGFMACATGSSDNLTVITWCDFPLTIRGTYCPLQQHPKRSRAALCAVSSVTCATFRR